MELLEISVAIPDKIRHLLRSVVASSGVPTTGWDRVDAQLKSWADDPEALADDGLEPPSLQSLPLIREVSQALRELPVDPPARLVPNCEAGAVFEWKQPPLLWTLEVEQDGALEVTVFRHGRILSRHRTA